MLERLAATEEMFKVPVSTIRDVAELTEASPNLIARILGEMRGPGELDNIQQGFQDHEGRIRVLEQKVERKRKTPSKQKPFELKQPPRIIGNLPLIPASDSEERKLLAIEKGQEPERIVAEYVDLLNREREVPDYRVIEGIPPGIKLLGLLFLCVLVMFILNALNIRPSRPPLPPTYELR